MLFESTKYTLRHIFLHEKALGASYGSLLSKKGPKLKFRDEKKNLEILRSHLALVKSRILTSIVMTQNLSDPVTVTQRPMGFFS